MAVLQASTNQFTLGFFSIPSYLIITSDNSQSVFYSVDSDSLSVSSSIQRNNFHIHYKNQGDKAIHVQAEDGKKISVHGWSQIYSPSLSTDSYLVFSTSQIDGISEYEYFSLPFNLASSVLIIASEDDTHITLPSTSLTLDRFQTHQIDSIPILSSLRVTSNKPVSVLSAKSCLDPIDTCDHLVEQVLPTHLWGKIFLVASFSVLKAGETIRVIFLKPSTVLTITCASINFHSTVISRGPGHWEDIELDQDQDGRDRFCAVEATDPVYVIQFAQESVGGTYMMTIPSIDQYGESFQGFYTQNYYSPLNFVTVYITPEYFIPGNEGVSVDGVPVDDWKAVECLNGSVCGYIAKPLLRSQRFHHTVSHTNPRARVGVSAYGYITSSNSSYGYPVSLYIPPDQSELGNEYS